MYLSNSATACQEWRVIDINHDNTNGTVDLMSKYAINDGSDYYKMPLTRAGSNYMTHFETSGYPPETMAFYFTSIDGSRKYHNYNSMYYNDLYTEGNGRYWLNNTLLKSFTSDVQDSMETMGVIVPQMETYFIAESHIGEGSTSYTKFFPSITLYDKVKIPSLAELGDDVLQMYMKYDKYDKDNYSGGTAYEGLKGDSGKCNAFCSKSGELVSCPYISTREYFVYRTKYTTAEGDTMYESDVEGMGYNINYKYCTGLSCYVLAPIIRFGKR